MARDRIDDELLQVGCWHPNAVARPLAAHERGRDVVAIAATRLDGVGRSEPIAVTIENQIGQERSRLTACWNAPLAPALPGELVLHRRPQIFINDGLVVSPMHLATMGDLAAIEAVAQDQIKCPAAQGDTAYKGAGLCLATFSTF